MEMARLQAQGGEKGRRKLTGCAQYAKAWMLEVQLGPVILVCILKDIVDRTIVPQEIVGCLLAKVGD